MQTIVSQLSLGVGAEECYAVLCRNNIELLQKMDFDILDIFCEFIRDLGPDSRFLKFMLNSCSCQGRGLDNIQELILR